MALAISVENLTYRYPNGTDALQGVDLALEAGKIVGLIGKNGSGKTTLAKHVNGLLKPSSGRIVVNGLDPARKTASEMAKHVGFVFQNPEDQIFESSVFEEVAFGPRNLGMDKETVMVAVTGALSRVGLQSSASEHPYNLTYGQRKMLCIASVLAMQPSIVILDEPNAGQDYAGLEVLGEILEEMKREEKTMLVISHDIEFVAKHCEEVVLMYEGKVLIHGSTRTVLSDNSKLKSSAVRPPQITRLAAKLSPLGIRPDVMTVDEMTDALMEIARRH